MFWTCRHIIIAIYKHCLIHLYRFSHSYPRNLVVELGNLPFEPEGGVLGWFWMGVLSTVRWSNVGSKLYICQILTKIEVKIRHFPNYCSNIEVETIHLHM